MKKTSAFLILAIAVVGIYGKFSANIIILFNLRSTVVFFCMYIG